MTTNYFKITHRFGYEFIFFDGRFAANTIAALTIAKNKIPFGMHSISVFKETKHTQGIPEIGTFDMKSPLLKMAS